MVPGWDTFFQDPAAWHNPLEGVDSADFVLGPDTSFNDKLIFQISHNMLTGSGQASFLVFPIDDRSDSLRITYRVFVSDSPLSADILDADQGGLIFPNPTDGPIQIADKRVESLTLIDATGKGQVLKRKTDDSWDVSHLADGTYVVMLTYEDGSHAYTRVAVLN
jgi:hypothetical protein